MALTSCGFVTETSASSSWVALTAIQRTSVGGTSALRSTATSKFPNGLSSLSLSGYEARESGRTTTVTESPKRASEAPIRPPTPPAPRIACRKVGMRLVLSYGGGHTLENLGLAQGVVA